ncbi:hypothetical protein C2845_PM02G17110 [Panicum miliaceum]|uniref:Uncharacterized protein n=1 Tax=Panicum miliaceum TaxID=4540 RepID=A0A3L6S4I5_PANMI|nr:hypothetical protein C2845_PM02G17110 [Panicum miliaceum]
MAGIVGDATDNHEEASMKKLALQTALLVWLATSNIRGSPSSLKGIDLTIWIRKKLIAMIL